MDNNIRNKIALLAILALLFSFLFGLFWYFISFNPFSTYQIYTKDDVSGLVVSAPVEFHGVEIGSVKTIELINPHLVRILIKVNKNTPITKSTIATVTGRGVTNKGFIGYVYISLDDTNEDLHSFFTIPNHDYPTIPTRPSVTITMDSVINNLSKDAQKIVDILNSLLDEQTVTSLKELIHNLNLVTKTLAKNNKKLNSLIINTENASYQFKPLLTSSNSTINSLNTQILPRAYHSLTNLEDLTDVMSNLVNKLEQDPSMLVWGTSPPKLGPGER